MGRLPKSTRRKFRLKKILQPSNPRRRSRFEARAPINIFYIYYYSKNSLDEQFEKSSHIYTNSTRRLYMSNTMTEDNTLNVLLCNTFKLFNT